MKKYFQNFSAKDALAPLAVLLAVIGLSLWRAGEFSIPILLTAVLSALFALCCIAGGLFLLASVVKRVALAFGVPLGGWGSTQSLRAFISARRHKLAQSGNSGPLARGRTQFLLGLAFGELGTRETDIDALRQSAEAFRDALPALQAAGKGSKWALTQSNLAVTLLHLSHQELGTKSLEEAVEALRAAAEHWEKADNKADWSNVQWQLCGVLAELGLRKEGTERLAEAVAAGRAALAAEDNEEVPLAGARLEINLAWALACLGEREPGTNSLEEAVALVRDALPVIAEDKGDLLDKDESIEWQALLLGSLGLALRCLGERRNDAELLQQAVEALRSTTPLRMDKNAYDWAVSQDELARALHTLSLRRAKPDLPSDSLAASDAALGVLTRET